MEKFERIKEERAHKPPLWEPSGNMCSDIRAMLYGSELVYAFAVLRELARENDMEKEYLIGIAPGNAEERQKILSEGIKDKITTKDIVDFVQSNLKRLEDVSRICSDLFVETLLDMGKMENAYIVKFDAHRAGSTFVYGIYVNHDLKRISLSFRGTAEMGDWGANLKYFKEPLNPSDSLLELGFDEKKKIRVHGGFKEYLMGSHPSHDCKYKDIKGELVELYTSGECNGYDLIVTGHSLGGALSTLMSFQLASSGKISKHLGNKPLVNISFASPYVGGEVFGEAFKMLEKAGKLQHIRVSNENDIVPVLVAMPDFRHVGINLHLDDTKDYALEYQGKRSLWWQWTPFFPWLANLSNHGLEEYDTRFKKVKTAIRHMTINDVYGNSSITKDFIE